MIEILDQQKCIGCGTCVEVCTKDVLRYDDEKSAAYIAYFDDCQTCYNCEMHCPAEAIFVHPYHRDKVRPW
ncbi:MAG: ferredoxin family protein [Deferribacteraceae bacterium]|jgi:NAD-dependent dihydropyrimidine dehydrogenase PreA subunit|nr:ferredoxin family protein [Deferribacteraceae bacterium]